MLKHLRRLWALAVRRDAFESHMAEELRFHLESRAADLERRGLAPDAARRQARLEFGNPAAYHDRCRDARGLHLVDDFLSDVRFALRGFRRHKMLSAIVVATLTLGIGIGSSVFTIVSAIALRPMIDADANTFLRIYARATEDRTRPNPFGAQASTEEYFAFRDGLRTVSALAAYGHLSTTLGGDDAQPGRVNLVTCNFFDVYGPPRAALGRLLQPSDCDTAAPVIVLSDTAWRTRFGADAGIVGRVVTVKGTPLTVVGVAPRSAAAIAFGLAWVPYTLRAQLKTGEDPRRLAAGHYGHDRWLNVAGRLAPGATRDQVAAELSVLAARQDRLHPGWTSGAVVTDGAMVNEPRERAGILSAIWLVMGTLTCLLLITCANVATLLLSRADARHQEVAIRLSLGAGRGRLLRMLLTETLTLAACAGAASVYIAYRLPAVLTAWLTAAAPELPLDPDWRVFAYLAGTVWVAGIAAGLAPALESARVDVVESLKGRRSTLGGRRSGARFRAALVATQVALGFVLLVGAALFLVTHYDTITRDVGLEAGHVLMPRVVYRASAGVSQPSADAIGAALRTVPGIMSIVFADTPPVFAPGTEEIVARGAVTKVRANGVSPGFFDAVGIPILRGRPLDGRDRPCAEGPCHVVISEALARDVLRREDAVGAILETTSRETLIVVGVARDTRVQQPRAPDPPLIYRPWANDRRAFQVLARFSGSIDHVGPAAAAKLRNAFPGAIVDTHTLRWPIDDWVEEMARIEALVVGLGAVAAALAGLGVFGVVSFAVSRRRHELGIRLALGAARRDMYSAVIAGSMTPVAVGLACGVALALAAAAVFPGSILRELQFTVSLRDPATYGVAAAVLLGIVTLALAVPARRAASIDPLAALRSE